MRAFKHFMIFMIVGALLSVVAVIITGNFIVILLSLIPLGFFIFIYFEVKSEIEYDENRAARQRSNFKNLVKYLDEQDIKVPKDL